MSTVIDNTYESVAAETPLSADPPKPTRRRLNRGIVAAVLVLLIAAVAGWYFYAQGSEETDDAQVDGHLIPIASRVDGTIQAVYVDDNQAV
ncbi:MAG TPA: hypothetical protein VHT24_02645, partial [Pseudacidobacterium sp.]|nr:hypothetical protein [Pseudacidobacterium sp.]